MKNTEDLRSVAAFITVKMRFITVSIGRIRSICFGHCIRTVDRRERLANGDGDAHSPQGLLAEMYASL